MLTSEFAQEMGNLVRSLEQRVVRNPSLMVQPTQNIGEENALDRIEEAIISLIAIHIMLRRRDDD